MLAQNQPCIHTCVSTKHQKWENTTIFIQFSISGTNVAVIAILRYSLSFSYCTISSSKCKYQNFAIACCSLSTVTTINYHLCHSLYARCIYWKDSKQLNSFYNLPVLGKQNWSVRSVSGKLWGRMALTKNKIILQ